MAAMARPELASNVLKDKSEGDWILKRRKLTLRENQSYHASPWRGHDSRSVSRRTREKFLQDLVSASAVYLLLCSV